MRLAERMPSKARLLPPLSRRSFVQYAALTTGLLALSRLRPASALTPQVPSVGLRLLTPHEADVLTAIVERIVFTGSDDLPPVSETRTIETIEQAVVQLDASAQSQLRWLLMAVQWGPLLFEGQLRTFTGLSPEARDRHLQNWAASRFETRRLALRALKNLSMLGYYAQDETWKAIHYDGPWTPRPRKDSNQ